MSKNAEQSKEFGKRISKILLDKDLTVRSAAEIAGVTASKLQSWKTGVLPSSDFGGLARLAKVCGVSMEWLLTGENTTEPGIKDVFVDGGDIFSGYLEVKIKRIIPKKSTGDDK